MSWRLAIGERAYSSWSLRGWLCFAAFGIEVETTLCPMDSPAFAQGLAAFAPARTVPALLTPDGAVVWDTLAIAETVAERFPRAGHWPEDPADRAFARGLAAEMHSGFAALRGACAMQLFGVFEGFAAPEAARADLARVEALWAAARTRRRGEGPWLLGAYSLADVFYAPVAMRIIGYDLAVSPEARAYAMAHARHPAILRWRAEALENPRRLPTGGDGLPLRDWPV